MIPRPRPERFRLRRTMMFMNAQKPGLIKDAYIYGCDSIMLDLEDAVAENQKDAARFSLYHALKTIDYGDTEVIVRINGLDTPHWQEDVRVCVAGGADGIRIAKCESAQDVLTCICSKMIRRHPHVFAQAQAETSEDVLRNWEAIKKDEKSLRTQTEVMRDVPRTFPALMRAAKVQKKARDVGFDWDDAREALKKVREEADEVEEVLQNPEKLAGELGDLLFAAVNVCRMKKVPPELALNATTEKFIRRFSHIEEAARAQGRNLRDMTLREMDALWEEAKASERKK